MSQGHSYSYSNFFVVCLFTLLLTLNSTDVFSENPLCIVVDVDSGTWVSRGDKSVKTTIGVGDLVYEGDKLEVHHGGSVQLIFDTQGKNIALIRGGSQIEFSKSDVTNIKMAKGDLALYLDKRNRREKFQVSTPSSIIEAHGTRFRILSDEVGTTDIMSYKGRVYVAGRNTDGSKSWDFVMLYGKEKTSIMGAGEAPLPVAELSIRDLKDSEDIGTQIELARANMKTDQLLKSILGRYKPLLGKQPPTPRIIPSVTNIAEDTEKKEDDTELLFF